MKKIIALITLTLMLAISVFAADNVIVQPNTGVAYLKDALNHLAPLWVGYTTDGDGNLHLLNSPDAVDDTLIFNQNGKMFLKDASNRLINAQVLYTTDGNGHIMPIPMPSSGGGSWGSITGILSAQTDLQNALNLKAPLAAPSFSGTTSISVLAMPSATPSTVAIFNGSKQLVSSGVSAATLSFLDIGSSLTALLSGKQASLSFTAPLVNTANTVTCNVASGSQPGCISTADWSTFNSKQSALTLGNLTSSTTGVSIGSGTGSVVGSGTTVNIQTASGSQPGLLSAADYNTFNNKASSAYTPATPSAWPSPTPTTVVGALDSLASNKAPVFSDTRTVYVSKAGNDSTCAIGRMDLPCLTITQAAVLVNANSPGQLAPYLIKLKGVGTFTEASLQLPIWTWISGDEGLPTGGVSKISATGCLTLHSGWAAGSMRGGLMNVYMNCATFDLQALSAVASHAIELVNVGFTGNVIFRANVDNLDFMDMIGCRLFGNYNHSGGLLNVARSDLFGNVTLDNLGTKNFDGDIYHTYIGGTLALNQSLGKSLTARAELDQMDGGYSTSGSASLTVTAGSYLPATSANWASVPTTVHGALDNLAGGAFIKALINGASSATNAPLVFKNGHIKSTQTTAPTALVNANAGTGGSCSVANGTDTAGQITIVTGTVGVSTGDYCDLTFNKTYNVAPICVLTPASSTLSTSTYVTSSTSVASVNFAVAGGISSTYIMNYNCIETQ